MFDYDSGDFITVVFLTAVILVYLIPRILKLTVSLYKRVKLLINGGEK